MPTPLSTPRSALALLLALTVSGAFNVACRGKQAPPGAAAVPPLRFAGVDLEYALGRVTTEAGWVLALDEITPKDQSPDLALVRVDLDLPAGSLDDALRRLKSEVGGFDYALEDGVVYVRSNMLVTSKTSLDEPLLDGDSFEGELGQLVKYIMARHPTSFITVQYVQDGFAGPPAKIQIPPKSSVRDALVAYARASKSGWVMHRAGQLTHDSSGKPSIVGTSIEPLAPRKTTSRLPAVYNRLSGVSALADASERLKTPFVVYDRSVLMDVRGILNLVLQKDPKLPLKETLDNLAQSGFGASAWHFHWRDEDGVPVIRTNHFLYYLRGRDLLSGELLPGDFEGSLPELARFINSHQRQATGEVLMGGEIAAGMPRGKIHVGEGETVGQALVAFAKASGVSPYVIVLDMLNPLTGQMVQHSRAWKGAYLEDLSEWHTKPGDERASGVVSQGQAEGATK